jgi:hypothetical protein
MNRNDEDVTDFFDPAQPLAEPGSETLIAAINIFNFPRSVNAG